MASPKSRTTAAKKPVTEKQPRTAKKPTAKKPLTTAKKPTAKKRPAAEQEASPSPLFQRVVTALTAYRDVSVRPGWSAGSLVLKTGDKMFAMCIRGDLVVKLPKPAVDQLVDGGQASRFDPKRNGRVMKEWAVLPPVTAVAGTWRELAEQARAFVQGPAAVARTRRPR